MNDASAQLLLEEVREMRKLLELLAEPAIAQRDAKRRAELRSIVGSSKPKQKSVFLMDGNRTQADIVKDTSVNQGHLCTMVGRLDQAGLLVNGKKQPKLSISIPQDFFDAETQ